MLTYTRLSDYLKEAFHLSSGEKIYKLALSSGCTCPNRDGTLGDRGCIFCSRGGSGEFASSSVLSISEQIEQGKKLLKNKAPNCRYIAYFQSFTNTYAPATVLRPLFTEAILHPEVAVLSIATRPDCLGPEILDLLEELSRIKPVWVELGLQSIHPETAHYIRRGYELSLFDKAVHDLKAIGVSVIVHLILGLPGEDEEDMVQSACYVSNLLMKKRSGSATTENDFSKKTPPADGIKLQLLHVLKDTDLADAYERHEFEVLEMDTYFRILKHCVEVIDPSLVLHRITGDGAKKDLIAPLWSANKKVVLNNWNHFIS